MAGFGFVAEIVVEKKIYKPANGTEGEEFFNTFCYKCKNYKVVDEVADIEDCWYGHIFAAEINEKTDLDYPDEWCYDENDRPTCTDFERK